MERKEAHMTLPAQQKLMNGDNESHNNVLQKIRHCTQGRCYDAVILPFFLQGSWVNMLIQLWRANLIAVAESMFQLIRC